ncbi:3beta-hydroxysteroid-dehydrogenase/decarboxylase-like isoform X2 [Magnolia sinica]|uniref:3beta-hydroxysteroid- dehydrogenase/decarboxylase-like isoform X2 n=1 Tax=Magnolia sinica TaxID=86752 RepID=UPI0026582FA3|nr:3beta-hydroxysteroid-dehydrogenase/decarboxylase-like isoform X2 [Magnolia sinica]
MAIDESSSKENPRICTVLGGRSFIGRSLVQLLLKSEQWTVRIAGSAPSLILDRKEQNSILSDAVSIGRASYFQVDVREKSQVCEAIEGSTVVFHMDALDLSVHDIYHHYMVTVQGTKNVINACRECKVKRLIYNSSADVVFDGVHSIHNGDESLPYPWRYEDRLSDFRSQAEALILFANGTDGLLTCALRPSNVFGPGDTHFIPYLIGEARSVRAKGMVKICVTSPMLTMLPMPIFVQSKLYVQGWLLWLERPWIHLPAMLVLIVVVLLEWVHKKFGPHINCQPQLNPSLVHFLSCTRTFNCSNAQKQLGYSPIVSLEEGVTLTIESFSHLSGDSSYLRYRDCNKPSKVDKLLGGGKVADILLWRDEKKTFTCLLALVFLLCWFFLSGRTFISSMARLLVLVSVILFIHGILPFTMFGFAIEKIPPSYFEASETVLKDRLTFLATTWNEGVVCTLRTLAQGDDWSLFFKVACSLYFLKLFLSFSFPVMASVGLVLAFTIFIVYEQYEEEVDKLLITSHSYVKKSKEFLDGHLPPFLAAFLSNNQRLGQDDRSSQKHQ